ncbi:MAG: helix-turn-helix domain-containing protein [Chloroflexota bacterium]|nr:helix-turn-helix domain-containing protein [Chloroflexota bacterium]
MSTQRQIPELESTGSDFDLSVSGTIDELISEYAGDDEVSSDFLKARWIAHTLSTMRTCRVDHELTQADMAEALGTKQPSVARLERGEDITLSRMWDYFYACGMAPLQIPFVEFGKLKGFVVEFPDRPTTLSAVLGHSYSSRALKPTNVALQPLRQTIAGLTSGPAQSQQKMVFGNPQMSEQAWVTNSRRIGSASKVKVSTFDPFATDQGLSVPRESTPVREEVGAREGLRDQSQNRERVV